MKHVGRYITLACRSAPNRTEHVNVGVLVLDADNRWRVHIASDLRKLRAFDPSTSEEAVRAWEAELPRLLQGCEGDFAQAARTLRAFGYAVANVEPGSFSYHDHDSYVARIADILRAQVAPPAAARDKKREPASRLHHDLRESFKVRGWLGKRIDAHEIVEHYPIGPLVEAEFALRNGVLHVLQTVDLRGGESSTKKREVRAKALTLDMARDVENDAMTYAVMAGADSALADDVQALLQRYSSRVWRWESRHDMDELIDTLGKATGRPSKALPLPA